MSESVPDNFFTDISRFVLGGADGILFGDKGPLFVYSATPPALAGWTAKDRGPLKDTRLADLGTDWRGLYEDDINNGATYRKPRYGVNWANYANRNITSRRLHSFGTYPSYIAINGEVMDTDTPYVLGACVTQVTNTNAVDYLDYYLILVTGHTGVDWVVRKCPVDLAIANTPTWTTIGTFNWNSRTTNFTFPVGSGREESFVPIYFHPLGKEGKQVAVCDDSLGNNRQNMIRVATITINDAVTIATYADTVQGPYTYDKIVNNNITGSSTVMDTLNEANGPGSVDAVIGGNTGPQFTTYEQTISNIIIGIDYAPDGTEKQLTTTFNMDMKVGQDSVEFFNKTLEQGWIPDQNEPTPAEIQTWIDAIINETAVPTYRWWYFAHVGWRKNTGHVSLVPALTCERSQRIFAGGSEILEPDSNEPLNLTRVYSQITEQEYAQREQPVQSSNAGTQENPIFSWIFSPSSAGHPAIDPDPTLPGDFTVLDSNAYTAHATDFAFIDLRMDFYVFRVTKPESVVITPNGSEYPANPNVKEKWFVRWNGTTVEVDPVNLPEVTRNDDTDADSLNTTNLALLDGRAFIQQGVSDFLTLPNGTTAQDIDNLISPTGDNDTLVDPFLYVFNNNIFLPPLGATHPKGGAVYVHLNDSAVTWINDADVDTLLASIGTTNAAAWNSHLAYVLNAPKAT